MKGVKTALYVLVLAVISFMGLWGFCFGISCVGGKDIRFIDGHWTCIKQRIYQGSASATRIVDTDLHIYRKYLQGGLDLIHVGWQEVPLENVPESKAKQLEVARKAIKPILWDTRKREEAERRAKLEREKKEGGVTK